mgnify:CR=1 FL=1
MSAQTLQTITAHIVLYRDSDTGLAWVENGSSGVRHTAHPNIDETGSVAGMRDRGYWGRNDRTVTLDGFIYNIDRSVVDDEYDRLANDHCECGGNHSPAQ